MQGTGCQRIREGPGCGLASAGVTTPFTSSKSVSSGRQRLTAAPTNLPWGHRVPAAAASRAEPDQAALGVHWFHTSHSAHGPDPPMSCAPGLPHPLDGVPNHTDALRWPQTGPPAITCHPTLAGMSGPWCRADRPDPQGVSSSDLPAWGPFLLLLCPHHPPPASRVPSLPETLESFPRS